MSSRIAGPGKLFSSHFRACARSRRCSFGSVSCSCDAAPRSVVRKRALPGASSPLSEQRRTWLIFADQIEIFQVKAWLATFKARNANPKFLGDCRKKKEKKTARSTCRGRSRPPPTIDRRSPQPRSLHVSFQICRVWFIYIGSLLTEEFYYPRSLSFFFH